MSGSTDDAVYVQAMRRAKDAMAQARFDVALSELDLALARRRESVEALNLKGALLARFRRTEEAIRCFDTALAVAPEAVECHYNKATLLQLVGRYQEAIKAFDRALAIKPDMPEALVNRGMVFAELRQLGEAIASFSAALTQRPDFAKAYAARAALFSENAEIERALADFAQARILAPDDAELRWNEAITMLLAGDFERGLAAFEWRPEGSLGAAPRPSGTRWRGQPFSNKTILLRAEQGLGDTIQFCRYAPLLAEKGARVVLDVQPQLKALLSTLGGVAQIVARGEAVPPYDYFCPLLSLPLLLRTSLENIPARVPYLKADESRVRKWRERLAVSGNALNVGIAWAGRPGRIDAGRSIPLRLFGALGSVPNTRLFSLQKEVGLDDLEQLPDEMRVETLGAFDGPGEAFLDTAAIMQSLDLVVTSDSAVAHLAGALGRPAWLALKLAPDWRWLLKRSDSPWYPTLRLFRQQRLDDWTDVFAAMARELAVLERQKTGSLA